MLPTLSTGNGLAGLRERISIAGGDFAAGPTDGGGFRLAARLPLSALESVQDTPGPEIPRQVRAHRPAIGANGSGSNGSGSNGLDSNGFGSNDAGSNDAGSNGSGSNDARSNGSSSNGGPHRTATADHSQRADR
jgi:hypothetical protein